MSYNDERLEEAKAAKNAALKEANQLFDGMVSQSDKFYQDQIDASKEWADTQTKLQQEQTDFAIEKIEQQKEQTRQDYVKEQSGAYADWQKQSNAYGTNAEQTASMGMENTGYSESSQVQMYTAYQNRVATARESFNRAVLNYDNQMTEARLQNNSILAEIAYNALKEQLELSLSGFQYKNQLLIDKMNTKLQIESVYNQNYKDVLGQINTEKALAEEIRQFNAQLAEEKRQYNASHALDQAQFAWQKAKASSSGSGSSGGTSSVKKSSGSSETRVRSGSGKSIDAKDSMPSVSTYEEAAAYMRKKGVASGDGGLMTKSEWARRKSAGSTAAEVQYSSYKEYLNHFVQWRTENPQK